MRALEIVHPDDKETVRNKAIKMLKGKQQEPYEYRIITKSGETKWILEAVAPVLYYGKRASLATFVDITDRINMTNALGISEQNLRASMNESPLGIRIINAGGKDLYVNQALLDIFGYGCVDELEDTPVSSLFAPNSIPGFLARREKRLRGEPGPDSFEIDIIRKDGAPRRLEVFQRQVLWNGQKQFQLLYNDITERKKAEEALRASEENFRNSLDNSPLGALIFTNDDEILYANRAMLDIYGYEHIEELRNTPRDKRYTPQSYADWLVRREKRRRGETAVIQYEISIVRKDGSIRHLQAFRKEVIWNGKKQFMLLYIDITEMKKITESLRMSEENFRNSLDSSPLGLLVITNDEEILYTNRAMLDIYGYENIEELRDTPVEKRYTPESYADLLARLEKRQAGGVVENEYEVSVIRKDGSVRILQAFRKPVNWNGERQLLLMYNDITEKKKLEDAVHLSEQNFRNSLDNFPFGVSIITADSENLYVNQKLLDIFGYKNYDEFKAQPAPERYTPESYEQFLIREKQRQAGITPPAYYEVSVVCPDGSVREMEVFQQPVVWDGKDRFMLIYNDITERKKAEKSLRESRARFIELANLLPQTVWELDTNGMFTFVNTTGLIAYGYSPQESRSITPQHFSQSFIPEDRARLIANHERVMKGEQLGGIEYTALRRDGTTYPVIVFSSRIVRDGVVVGERGITIDISDRKQAEARLREIEVLKETDRIRSELLANVSHELRTPLTSIKGFASTLLRDDVRWSEAEKKNFLKTIDQESDHLARLVNDLLDMAQIEAGVMVMQQEKSTFDEIINAVKYRLDNLCTRHKLIIGLPDNLPPVSADEKRIGQVITNLVENAVKYSTEGSQITISAQSTGDTVTVSVTDQGEGIPAQDIDKVFNRFFQVEDIVRGKKSGTGLGLSICRGIIEKHNGKIWVKSKPGEGSVFSFSLPVEQ